MKRTRAIISFLLSAALLEMVAGCSKGSGSNDGEAGAVSVEEPAVEEATGSSEQISLETVLQGKWRRIPDVAIYNFSPSVASIVLSDDPEKWSLAGVSGSTYTYESFPPENCDGCNFEPEKFTIEKINDNMLKGINGADDSYFYLIRSGVDNATIQGKIAGAGLGGLGLQKVAATYEVSLANHHDKNIAKVATLSEDGDFRVNEMKSGDYDITVKDSSTGSSVVSISNVTVDSAIGDIGVITLGNSGYNFKTELLPDSPFSFNNLDHEAVLRVTNIGSVQIKGVSYRITSSDPSIVFAENTGAGILNTMDANSSVEIKIKYSIRKMDLVEEKRVPLAIVLKDVKGNTWNDAAYLYIYNSFVNLSIKSSSSVAGVLIFKDRVLVPVNSSDSSIQVPYVTGYPFKLLLSAATLDEEAVYGVGIGNVEINSEDFPVFSETGAFEPNDVENMSTSIGLDEKKMGYLHVGDLDFFTFTFSDKKKLGSVPIVTAEVVFDENGDFVASPGETFHLRVKVKNIGIVGLNGAVGIVSSNNTELTFPSDPNFDGVKKLKFGDIDAGSESCGSYYDDGTCNGSDFYYLKVNLATNTPLGNALISLSLQDVFGDVYSISFNLPILRPAAIFEITPITATLLRDQTANFQIKVKNIGVAKTFRIIASANTSHAGIAFNSSQIFFGNVNPGDEKSACGEYLLECIGSGNSFFQITIAADAQVGPVPFVLNIVDSWGNVYPNTGFSLLIQ